MTQHSRALAGRGKRPSFAAPGSKSPIRFQRRWRPYGASSAHFLAAGPKRDPRTACLNPEMVMYYPVNLRHTLRPRGYQDDREQLIHVDLEASKAYWGGERCQKDRPLLKGRPLRPDGERSNAMVKQLSLEIPTSAGAFLQASLSKMRRSNPGNLSTLPRRISDQGQRLYGPGNEVPV
jgi:hypothetical protein